MMIKAIRHILVAAMLSCSAMVAVSAESHTSDGGISAVEISEPQIATGSHCIEITVFDERSHEAAIYALTGQLVKQLSLTEGKTTIELKPGYYIVRIDGRSKRVVVK